MGIQLFANLALLILVLAEKKEAVDEECRITRCSHHGPEIRFPFRVKDGQPEDCGHPGFQVSCHAKVTLLEFQYLANTSLQGIQLFLSGEVAVHSINYTSQEIEVDLGPSRYLTKNLTLVPTSTLSPHAIVFELYQGRRYIPDSNTTFFSCPSGIIGKSTFVTSLGGQTFPVYYFEDDTSTGQPSIASCTKIFNSSLPFSFLVGLPTTISWSTPNCRKCEAKGEYCKLMKNNTICLSKGIIIATLIGLLTLSVMMHATKICYRDIRTLFHTSETNLRYSDVIQVSVMVQLSLLQV